MRKPPAVLNKIQTDPFKTQRAGYDIKTSIKKENVKCQHYNYCSSMSSRQQSSSPNSSSSGHGSPESSTMAQNDISCDARASENDNEVKISDGRIEDSKDGSPLSSISRVNSSSPDSGYEHLSSTGKYNLAMHRKGFWKLF